MIFKLKTWYSLHKWTSIVTGIAILMWLITGLVMTAPDLISISHPEVHPQPPALDFHTVAMSPAEAIAHLKTNLSTDKGIKSVDLKQIHRQVAYQIVLADGSTHLIDVMTGQTLEITPALAETIARTVYPIQANVQQVELLQTHDSGHFYGDVPAYRVSFNDAQQTYVHVALNSGEVSVNNRATRLIELFTVLHTFEIFDILRPDQEELIGQLIWASSIITLLAAVIGYYLALPRRFLRR